MSLSPPAATAPPKGDALALALSLLTAVAVLFAGELAFRLSGSEARFAAEARHSALPGMLDSQGWDPDIAFLGDSRVLHGVRPEVVERVLRQQGAGELRAENLALPGLSPIGMLALSGYLTRRVHPPRLVVLGLSPYMLSTLQSPTYAREIRDFVFRLPELPAALAAGMPVEDALTVVTHEWLHAVRFRRRVIEWVIDGTGPKPAHDLGVEGFECAPRCTASMQHRRAEQRARLGTAQVLGADAAIDWTQLGYLRAAVEAFRRADIEVRFVTTPTASPIWVYYTDETLYGPAMRAYRRVAASVGQELYDDREIAQVEDWYFADGDHLSPEGATRHSVLLARRLLLPALGVPATPVRRFSPPAPSAGCRIVFDFEELHPEGWEVTGDAFSPLAVTGTRGGQSEVSGYVGVQLVNTATAMQSNRAVGSALSPAFRLDAPRLRLRVGGGDSSKLSARLELDGAVVREARGQRSEELRSVEWDVSAFRGQQVRLHLLDRGRAAWEHLLVDQVELCGAPQGADPQREDEPAVNAPER
ncbi:MAG: hypothetical protein GXP55_10210 [Deltaproteobacteria bacterium]|nr:hypothetical protein [Deltaproteobacteria bacterium]